MKKIDVIFNESNLETLKKLDEKSIDVVLTSPFYNTNKKAGNNRTLQNTSVKSGQYNYVRYDCHVDNMTDEQYSDYTVELFNGFDRCLKDNGVILYNLSYGESGAESMLKTMVDVSQKTNFTIADVLVWKKSNAFPNSVSSNKATRICEFVFVFCRKNEFRTFHSNKEVVSVRKTGQKMYSCFYNIIEAKNNDESCPYNKATFSTDFCKKLLEIYCPKNGVVYDAFMGSGTTAVACNRLGLHYIGSEISENQTKWANDRIEREQSQMTIFDYMGSKV